METKLSTIIIFAIAATSATFGLSCSDDAGKDAPDCSADETRNPITGACEVGSENVRPGPDAGPGTGDAASPADTDTPPVADDMSPSEDLPTTCEGNERRCNGSTVEFCVDGMFTAQQTCGEGLVCERGNCVPEDAGACTPGDTRCIGTASFQTCQDDGMTWADETSCTDGETCMGGVCTSGGCAGLINEKSNVGCEYFTMRHDQATGLQTLPHTVVVSNPGNQPVTIDVTSPGGLNPGIAQQTVQPFNSTVLNFPTTPMISQAGLSSNIYVIRSSQPVIATQFSPLNNPGFGSETSDASLLLPTNAIGQEYVVVGWRSLQPGGTYVDIVALEEDTMVTVESPLPLSGGAAGSVAANGSASFAIPQNQVLHLAENRGFLDSVLEPRHQRLCDLSRRRSDRRHDGDPRPAGEW